MPKKVFLCLLFLGIAGCAQHQSSTIPVGLSNGLDVGFPANGVSRIEGEDIRFYGERGFHGYVQKEILPKEHQPATDFVERALELSKKKDWKIKEISKDGYVGYVVYVENTATLHLASDQDAETVFTISTADQDKIDDVIATLKTPR
ncbi:MAG: hypothetical protein WBA20_12660 [Ketobacter sp.]|nr:MAG: hypothetical protein D6160_07985 [Ketobacter sp.]